MKEDSIFHLIRTVEQFNDKSIIEFTKSFKGDIGIAQILVLNVLSENGAMKQANLAQKLGYSKGGITHITTKLIQKGYAERKYDEEDRRIILLTITDEGRKILQEAEQTGKELRQKMYAVLSQEEVESLTTITEKMLHAL